MSYPPPPWKLQGYAFHTLQPVDVTRSRSLIPPEDAPEVVGTKSVFSPAT
ncbi:hypothetical protein [Lyngbya sp. CCY1209]|nr:hypothetical protein [Lyngbya sp. CCY1209]MEB3883734.1 hypothetical protein [Lyngbya sp. CCY1209]